MTPDEVAAVGRLAGEAGAGVAGHVQRVHRAVAGRVFHLLRPVATPVERVHDVVTGIAYVTVRTGLRGAGLAGGQALRCATPAGAPPLASSGAGAVAQAVLNGFVGAGLAARDDPLAIQMALREGGRDVAPTATDLAAAYPTATSHVVVFVHGLNGDDRSWRGRFSARLAADADCTPVHLRYSSGRSLADNGAALSDLLTAVVRAWPVPVDRLSIVGHSMGGLVARAACAAATADDAPWLPVLSELVSLGTPHGGARLARLAGVAGKALRAVPEAAPWAAYVDHSPGIRDLQRGLDLPGVPTARQHVVSATLAGLPGRLLGDLLVDPRSACACDHVEVVALEGFSHIDLLTRPEVYDAIRPWLTADHGEPDVAEPGHQRVASPSAARTGASSCSS